MDKYKYQILVIILCLLIGVSLGYFTKSTQTNKEIKNLTEQHKLELTKEINLSKQRIQIFEVKLDGLKTQHEKDSISITLLKKDILNHTIETNKQRTQAAKLNNDEKKKFILDYYKSN